MPRTVEEIRQEAQAARARGEIERAERWEQTAEVAERMERVQSAVRQLGSELRRARKPPDPRRR